MKKMDGETLDIVKENIEKMKQLFPEVFIEEKIDMEKLQVVLGNYIEDENERYDFTWNGKKDAVRIAQTPTTGTLRPDKENSKNWDETENLYIEGDNLEVLKLLQKSYHSKIKMIYIDPPYNTGNDFVYKDNYRDNLKNYLEFTEQVDDKGKKITTNSETGGRYHTDWLNMIYPRLRLARNLLTDDGVIFISIDDNEVHNLRKICDEIFGEINFVASIIWEKNFAPKNNTTKFSDNHDYIICYAKSISKFSRRLLPMTKEQKSRYENLDNDIRGIWKSDDLTSMGKGHIYEIITPNKDVKIPSDGRSWVVSKATYQELLDDNRIWFGQNGSNMPRLKKFISEVQQGIVPMTIWKHNQVGHTQGSKQYLKKIFDGKDLFETPKPVELIKKMIYLITEEDSIILDFFAGSSTTAHALMDLNLEDNGNRKFIMVQLPEETDQKSEAFKSGYKIISEIGRERIRRAGEKTKKANKDKEGIEDLDIGFKAFKLDSSNIKEWNPEYEDKEFDFESLVNNFIEDRSEEDILYEIILKYGIDLTTPIEENIIDGKTIYDIGFGSLYICLDSSIDEKIIEKIVNLNKESGMERARVVFKDTGFKNDEIKLNAKLTLENNGIEEVLSI